MFATLERMFVIEATNLHIWYSRICYGYVKISVMLWKHGTLVA